MKPKLINIVLLTLCLGLLLSGCGDAFKLIPPTPRATDLPAGTRGGQLSGIDWVAVEKYPSFGELDNMTKTVLLLDGDGLMHRAALPNDYDGTILGAIEDTGVERETREVSSEDIRRIAGLIDGFMELPDYIDTGVLDGDFEFITVSSGGESWRKGGLLPSGEGPKTFGALYEALWDAWEEGRHVETITILQEVSQPPLPAGPWEAGNTPGNYAKHIDAVEYEGKVYVTQNVHGKLPTVYLEEDGSVQLAPFTGIAQELDNWLYYWDNTPDSL